MFNFASKMLNSLIGTEEQANAQTVQPQQQQPRPTGPPPPLGSSQPFNQAPSRFPAAGGPANRPGLPANIGPGPPPNRPIFGGPPLGMNGNQQRPMGGPNGGIPQQPPGPRPQGMPMGGPRYQGPRGPMSRPGGPGGATSGQPGSPRMMAPGGGPRGPPMGAGPRGRFPPPGGVPVMGPAFRGPPGGMGGPRTGGPRDLRPMGPTPGGPRGAPAPNANALTRSAAPPPAVPNVVPEVDLSHLSAEERALIESVMAKAQMEEHSAPSPPNTMTRNKGQLARQISQPESDREREFGYQLESSNRRASVSFGDSSHVQQTRHCMQCGVRDISGREGPPGQSCADCRAIVCATCGRMAPALDHQGTVWICKTCFDRRPQNQWNNSQDAKTAEYRAELDYRSREYSPTPSPSPPPPLPKRSLSLTPPTDDLSPLSHDLGDGEDMGRASNPRSENPYRRQLISSLTSLPASLGEPGEVFKELTVTREDQEVRDILERPQAKNGDLDSENEPEADTGSDQSGAGSATVDASHRLKYEDVMGHSDDSDSDKDSDDDEPERDRDKTAASREDSQAEHEDEDDEEPEYAPGSAPAGLVPGVGLYEHNPGEVYTIAEEEEEAASPTAPDGVTSLSYRRQLSLSNLVAVHTAATVISTTNFTTTLTTTAAPATADGTGSGPPTQTPSSDGQGYMAADSMPGRMDSPHRTQLRPQRSLEGPNYAAMQATTQQPLSQPEASSPRQRLVYPAGNPYGNETIPLSPSGVPAGGILGSGLSLLPQARTPCSQQPLPMQPAQQQQLYEQLQQQQQQQQMHNINPFQQPASLPFQQQLQQTPANNMQNQLTSLQQQQLQQQQKLQQSNQQLNSQNSHPNQIPNQTTQNLNLNQNGQTVPTTQAKGTGTISGMLADFSRALGLGASSPRGTPSEEHQQFQQQNSQVQYGEYPTSTTGQFTTLSSQQPQLQQQTLGNLQQPLYAQANLSQSQANANLSNVPNQHYSTISSMQLTGQYPTQPLQNIVTQPHMLPQQQTAVQQQYPGSQPQQQQQTPQQQLDMYSQQQPQATTAVSYMNGTQSVPSNINANPFLQSNAPIQDPNAVANAAMTAAAAAAANLQSQQIQQQLIQQSVAQQTLQEQQHQLAFQQQQINQELMQLQHQAQHLKKLRRSLPHTSEQAQQYQQQLQELQALQQKLAAGMAAGNLPKLVSTNASVVSTIPTAALLHQSTVVSDSGKTVSGTIPRAIASTGYPVSEFGHVPILRPAEHLLQRARSRPYSPSTAADIATSPATGSGVIFTIGTPMATPLGTPAGTPRSARDTADSPDTLSETDSQKSLRLRRKLPILPPDQEAAPLPAQKRKDLLHKTIRDPLTFGGRQTSFEGGFMEKAFSTTGGGSSLARPTSETNLRQLANNDFCMNLGPRPGSALGLLQGSSVINSSGMRSALSETTFLKREKSLVESLAEVLPPDLHHLLGTAALTTTTSTYSDTGVDASRRRALEDDIMRMSDRDRERELRLRRELDKYASLRDPAKRLEMQRRLTQPLNVGTSLRARKGRGHRRQLSDPRLPAGHSFMREDHLTQESYLSLLKSRLPHKAYEYESIEDPIRRATEILDKRYGGGGSGNAPLTTSYSGTALSRLADDEEWLGNRRSTGNGGRVRRASESGGLGLGDYWGERSRSALSDLRRGREEKRTLTRKPRSWHPSPYGSDDEGDDDDPLNREMKKQRIKMEIARRRQQIDQNARLHDELVRLARLRETGDSNVSPSRLGPGTHGSHLSTSPGGSSSILKSIEEILRDEYGRRRTPYDAYGQTLSVSPTRRYNDYSSSAPGNMLAGKFASGGIITEEERSMERLASTFRTEFRTEDYTSGLYERLADLSPLASDMDVDLNHELPPMPLLPDLPSRSRKLLEDLGASPLAESREESLHAMAQKDRERELKKTNEKPRTSSLKRYPYPVKRILLSCDSGENVGMKIVGGMSLPYTKDCGAIVEEISPGGIADTLGQVKEGDQVLEWNGLILSGKSAGEVQSIVAQSKGEVEVVLRDRDTVHRQKHSLDLNGNDSRDKSYSPQRPQANGMSHHLSGSSDIVDTDVKKRKWSLPLGQVQLLVCYDVRAHILYVTVLRARGLQTRKPDGDSRPEPFIKCNLLPGGIELQRRTRFLSSTSNPEWHQTMVYECISPEDLRCRKLELSAWHYQSDQGQRHEFLGELLLDLGDQSVVDEQPHWYNLQDNAEGMASIPRSRPPVPHTVLNGKHSVVALGRRNTQSVSLLQSAMTPGHDGMSQAGCHGSMCCIF